jgi:hypothetical protein
MKLTKKIALGLVLFAIAAPAFAQISGITAPNAPITSLGGVSTTITKIVNWMIGLFWVIAVAFLIWAAFVYLTAGGDEEKIKEAKSRVVYALIAAAIALLSTGIQAIATSLLTGA